MEFKEFLNTSNANVDESAILKLELITTINTLIGTAEIGMLKRVAKMLTSTTDKPAE